MNSPAVDIKDILEQDSSVDVGTFNTDLFVSKMPETPHACVAVYDAPAWKPPAVNFTLYFPMVQVRIRGAVGSYTTTYTKAENVRSVLHTVRNQIWNSTTYHAIWTETDIIALGYDEKNRPLFSINFHIMRST